MANMQSTTFDEIVKLAGDFVTQQKGTWDHSAWLGFLSTLQKRDFHLSEDMQAYVGQLLEAMKRFYQATASTRSIEEALTAVAKDSVAFVKAHKAVWGHSDWEAFARQVQSNTQSLSEETMSYLGGILESVKAFYAISPVSLSGSGPPSVVSKKPAVAKVEKQQSVVEKVEKKRAKAPVKERPVSEDDLTAIAGIGPALQRKLKQQGISSFAQLAALSDAEIERLENSIIKFPGRIKRDDWVGQAQRLSQ